MSEPTGLVAYCGYSGGALLIPANAIAEDQSGAWFALPGPAFDVTPAIRSLLVDRNGEAFIQRADHLLDCEPKPLIATTIGVDTPSEHREDEDAVERVWLEARAAIDLARIERMSVDPDHGDWISQDVEIVVDGERTLAVAEGVAYDVTASLPALVRRIEHDVSLGDPTRLLAHGIGMRMGPYPLEMESSDPAVFTYSTFPLNLQGYFGAFESRGPISEGELLSQRESVVSVHSILTEYSQGFAGAFETPQDRAWVLTDSLNLDRDHVFVVGDVDAFASGSGPLRLMVSPLGFNVVTVSLHSPEWAMEVGREGDASVVDQGERIPRGCLELAGSREVIRIDRATVLEWAEATHPSVRRDSFGEIAALPGYVPLRSAGVLDAFGDIDRHYPIRERFPRRDDGPEGSQPAEPSRNPPHAGPGEEVGDSGPRVPEATRSPASPRRAPRWRRDPNARTDRQARHDSGEVVRNEGVSGETDGDASPPPGDGRRHDGTRNVASRRNGRSRDGDTGTASQRPLPSGAVERVRNSVLGRDRDSGAQQEPRGSGGMEGR